MRYSLPTLAEIQAFKRGILANVGNAIMRESHDSAYRAKSGRHYPNLPNRSSAPYESFAKQSDTLTTSIDNYVDELESKVYIGSNVKYLRYLELGTNKMIKRPTLNNAVENTNIDRIVTNEIERFFR